MNKRESLVPTAVLLGTLLVLLIACSRLTNMPGTPKPTAPPDGMAAGLPGLNTIADLVTVVGLPTAITTLILSLRELRRRPVLVFGFESERDEVTRRTRVWSSEKKIKPLYNENQELSEPKTLRIIGANIGDRVATNALWNLDFPLDVYIAERQSAQGAFMLDNGIQRSLPKCPTLNPHDVVVFEYTLKYPVKMERMPIQATVSSAETIDVAFNLVVNLSD